MEERQEDGGKLRGSLVFYCLCGCRQQTHCLDDIFPIRLVTEVGERLKWHSRHLAEVLSQVRPINCRDSHGKRLSHSLRVTQAQCCVVLGEECMDGADSLHRKVLLAVDAELA